MFFIWIWIQEVSHNVDLCRYIQSIAWLFPGNCFLDFSTVLASVAEPEPVELKLFWDLEPEPEAKINFN